MGTIVWTFCILVLYMLPSVIAHDRKHPRKAGVIALNLLLGWSILGWIGALIWAFSCDKPKKEQAAE